MTPLVFFLLQARGATWVVDPAGGGDATTIAEGVALLSEGDTLEVRAGTYHEADIVVPLDGVSIVGDGWETTVIDASAATHYGISMGYASIIDGITVSGADMYGVGGLDLIVSNCALVDNIYGIWSDIGSLAVYNSVIVGGGNGIGFQYSLTELTVENSLFIDNSNRAVNSSWRLTRTCSPYNIHHNLFVGSGIAYMEGQCEDGSHSTLNLTNNIFISVDIPWQGSAYWDAVISNNLLSTDSTMGECTWSDSTVTCADNLQADPDFVAWSDDGDWTNDDFHLLGGSAGVDHGVSGVAISAADYDGVTRPIDGDLDGTADPDAGPYEYNPDGDGDGYSDTAAGGDDCDDADASVNPGEDETWYDGTDQDCDGRDDDQDGDGSGVAEDCDDTDAGRSPGVAEICGDGVDQDCDALDRACDSGGGGDSADTDDTADRPGAFDSAPPGDTGGKAPGCAGCAGSGAASLLPLLLAGALRRRRRR